MKRIDSRLSARHAMRALFAVVATGLLLSGCSDSGDDGGTMAPPVNVPVLTELIPVRTVAGDTVRVVGTDFGSAADGRAVLFPTGGGVAPQPTVEADVIEWSETEIVVLVPNGAGDGNVVVAVEGEQSNALSFETAPRVISFENDLTTTIFEPRGCQACHFGGTGNAGFSVLTAEDVLRGGNNGPAAIPRRASESLIFLKVTDPPFGQRMPQGSPALPDSEVVMISDWINQGARDN